MKPRSINIFLIDGDRNGIRVAQIMMSTIEAKAYHIPGSHSYAPTRISEAWGERLFCSEEEARTAGWRGPRG